MYAKAAVIGKHDGLSLSKFAAHLCNDRFLFL
jgi:hypothetical protein